MQTISCLNLKGGSGKTTMAVNLAGALGGVVLDLDPQLSATTWEPNGRSLACFTVSGITSIALSQGYPL